MPRGYHKPLTAVQKQQIKDEFLRKPIKRLAKELGITSGRIMRFLAKHDLEIPQQLRDYRKRMGCYQKGNVPLNKGKKIEEYMSPEAIERSKKTRFKKGNVPHNANPEGDGAIVTRIDKCGIPYQYIRLSMGVWDLYHRHLWRQAHGEIPENHMIIFIDGDTSNTKLENLKCISKAENMFRNSKNKYPEELIPTLVLNRKLELKLKELSDEK